MKPRQIATNPQHQNSKCLGLLGNIFNQTVVRLKCTPRKFIKHPTHNYLIVLETDHRMHTNQDKEEIKRELKVRRRHSSPMQARPNEPKLELALRIRKL